MFGDTPSEFRNEIRSQKARMTGLFGVVGTDVKIQYQSVAEIRTLGPIAVSISLVTFIRD